MTNTGKQLAVVTGASVGIGYELAKLCAQDGFDLVVAADQPSIHQAAEDLRKSGVAVDPVQCDLATTEGVEKLYAVIRGRPVDALLANAGHGLGGSFLDQNFDEARHVIDTNVTGTLYLIQKIGRDMRSRGSGRILITGSEAGFIPGAFHAVYNGTKAFIDSFSFALREELRDSGVTVTCLMPSATATDFFERARMTDAKIGRSSKDDPAFVAREGYAALMKGRGDIVPGLYNKIRTGAATVTPAGLLARAHAMQARPGSGEQVSQSALPAVLLGAGAALFLAWRASQGWRAAVRTATGHSQPGTPHGRPRGPMVATSR